MCPGLERVCGAGACPVRREQGSCRPEEWQSPVWARAAIKVNERLTLGSARRAARVASHREARRCARRQREIREAEGRDRGVNSAPASPAKNREGRAMALPFSFCSACCFESGGLCRQARGQRIDIRSPPNARRETDVKSKSSLGSHIHQRSFHPNIRIRACRDGMRIFGRGPLGARR
jgi:hypothetical protein